MKYAQLKVPEALWESIKQHADVAAKSATSFANEILKDSLHEMDAAKPGIPAVIEIYKIAAKRTDTQAKKPGKVTYPTGEE